MLSTLKVLGIMLIVSMRILSGPITKVFWRRLEVGRVETGTCALLPRDNSTEKIISDIGRNSLNSSGFIPQNRKIEPFIALNLVTPAISVKNGQFRAANDLQLEANT